MENNLPWKVPHQGSLALNLGPHLLQARIQMLDLILVKANRIVEDVSTLMQDVGKLPDSPMIILIGGTKAREVGRINFLPNVIKINWHSSGHNEIVCRRW